MVILSSMVLIVVLNAVLNVVLVLSTMVLTVSEGAADSLPALRLSK